MIANQCTLVLFISIFVINFEKSNSIPQTKNEVLKLPNNNDVNLNLVYQWKYLDYSFPSKIERESAIAKGDYVLQTGLPIDIDIERKRRGERRKFLTIPRFQSGIPFSLAEITDLQNQNGNGPKIKAYPSYLKWHKDTQNGKHCDRITSIFRIAIDECNRMWVIDTGRVGSTQYCPPQLLIFDLTTDTLFHRYKFPNNLYKPGVSLFITPIVDTRDPPPIGNCLNSRLYIADVTGYGLIVYDSTQDAAWRIEHETMRSAEPFTNFTIAGENFTLADGMFALAVTPPSFKNLRRVLFYHPLANNIEVIVPLDILDKRELWTNPNANKDAFQIVGRRNEQASAQAIDSRGNLFFGLVNTIGIGSWNFMKPWNGNSSAVIINPETLQFASALKILRNQLNQEELWVLTGRLQKVMAGTLNTNEVNFRIQKTLVNNLVCENSHN